MNALTNFNAATQLTMSSREIAELLGCRHDNVKRTVERLAERVVITLPPMEETSFKDAAGKTQWTSVYRIGKRDSYVIVAQLSPEFTAALVDRWQELEAQQAKRAPAVPQSFAEALRLAAELEEQRAALAMQNEQLSIENEAMSEELNLLTVDEFRALSHLYLAKGQSQKLSHLAKSYCLSKGIEITKQTRFLPSIGCDTKLNVYPREALEHAALVMGLL